MHDRSRSGVIQVIVVAGLCIVFLGIFWSVLTLPVSAMLASNIAVGLGTEYQGTVLFLQVLITILPLLIGVSVVAWGWVRTVEERETGFSSV